MNAESKSIRTLTTSGARRILADAKREAVRGGDSVCIVVLDHRGSVLAAECADSATIASFDVALAKARHAHRFNRPTSYQDELLSNGTLQVLAVPDMLPLAGGRPLVEEGALVGAVGVSGADSTRDDEIARVGAGHLEQPETNREAN
jgi:glc operon protein GlcG